VADVPQELLRQMCADLRDLWTQAGGPALRPLSEQVQLSKSQVGNILNGQIRRPPEWAVVQGLIGSFVHHAREHGREHRLSLSTGIGEYWRPRYSMIEHAFDKAPRGRRTPAPAEGHHGAEPSVGTGRQRVVPRQLPAAVRHFAGRSIEVAVLLDLIKATEETGGTVVISAIHGTAGIGKTALAVHLAHRVADSFPDGQLYVNLRGFDPAGSPMDPAEALRGFLDALHVPGDQLPTEVEAQARLYRSLLADRRMLVVLDNARDADQVRPLLPGTPGCLVIATSRDQLGSLVAVEGAHPLTLGVLSAAEALELLERRLGAERVAAEPDAVSEIVEHCARLPLALAIVAARAATYPDFPLAALADELREEQDGLSAFAGGDLASDVRAVLSCSYRSISPTAATMFRRLGLHPGPDVALRAAASLAGSTVSQVRRPISELANANLISEHVPGRFTFHDLLRAYAAELVETLDDEEHRRAARHRLLDHYLHTARAAARLLDAHRRDVDIAPVRAGVTTTPVADAGQALAWFTAERRALTSGIELAAGHGFAPHAWQLAWACAGFLHRRGHWQDHATVQRTALAAAQHAGDRLGEALAHDGLAQAYGQLTRYDDAHAHYRLALRCCTEMGDDVGCAYAHTGLSWILECLGSADEALDHAYRALELFRRTAHHAGEARTLNAVGWRLAQLGEHRQCLAYCEQAVPLLEHLGDRYGLAATWDTIGYAHHHLGDYRQSAACYRRGIDLCRDVGDRYDEALILTHLGDTHRAAGDRDGARDAWRRGFDILDELGHRDAAGVRAKLDELENRD
jgi:tetratricopeptide (TPR) repeat protein